MVGDVRAQLIADGMNDYAALHPVAKRHPREKAMVWLLRPFAGWADLGRIFGRHGQTMSSWHYSVSRAIRSADFRERAEPTMAATQRLIAAGALPGASPGGRNSLPFDDGQRIDFDSVPCDDEGETRRRIKEQVRAAYEREGKTS